MSAAWAHETRRPARLRSNGRDLDLSPTRFGWLSPSDPGAPLQSLRERYRESGYLLLKGLLPPEDVWAFRGQVFAHLADSGLIAAGSDPREGIAAPADSVNAARARAALMEIARSTLFEALCLHPHLRGFLDAFLEGLTYLYGRKIIRYTRPGDPSATGAHYDLVYIRGGTDRLVTAWIPIGDVPVEMGGLLYLEGSHPLGRRLEAEFAAKNADLPEEERISAFNRNMNEGGWLTKDLPQMAERFDARWLAADYKAGDVVLHSPYIVHAATMNEDAAGRMRLSTDVRYQRADDPIDRRWGEPWFLGDGL